MRRPQPSRTERVISVALHRWVVSCVFQSLASFKIGMTALTGGVASGEML